MKQVVLQYLDNGKVQISSNDIQRLKRWLDNGYCIAPHKIQGGYQVTVSDEWFYRSTFRRRAHPSKNTGRA